MLLGLVSVLIAVVAVVTLLGQDVLPASDLPVVAAACTGNPISGAKGYGGGRSGFISYVQNQPGDSFSHSANPDPDLVPPGELAEVETVLCLDAPVAEIEDTCLYGEEGGTDTMIYSFENRSVSRTARLVDPSTGQTLASQTTTNEAPVCDDTAFDLSTASEELFWADAPDLGSFNEWIFAQLGT